MDNYRFKIDISHKELGLEYKVIKPHTPKQNGRVERSYKKYKSQEESLVTIYSTQNIHFQKSK